MARLSIEHYRATAAMTPDHARKSSRILGIFKSRSNLSPSTVSTAQNFIPDSVPLSPPTSLTALTSKPGFEKVGVHPSERTLLFEVQRELDGGTRISEALGMQEMELGSVGKPHNLDTTSDDVNVQLEDEASGEVVKVGQNGEENPTMDLCKATLVKPQAVQEGSKNNSKRKGPLLQPSPAEDATTSRRTSSLSPENGEDEHLECDDDDHMRNDETSLPSTMASSDGGLRVPTTGDNHLFRFTGVQDYDSDDDIEPCKRRTVGLDTKRAPGLLPPEEVFTMPNFGFSAPRSETFLIDTDDEDHEENCFNFEELYASNNSICNTQLKQGIREYVATKITEALKEYDQKEAKPSITKPVHITIHLSLPASTAAVNSNDPQIAPRRQNIFEGSKSILALPIKDMKLARALQAIVIGCYIATAFALIFQGAELFIKTFVAFLLFLIIYAAVMESKQSSQNIGSGDSSDLLLAPVAYVADLLLEKFQNRTRMVMIAAITMFVDVLQDVTDIKAYFKAG